MWIYVYVVDLLKKNLAFQKKKIWLSANYMKENMFSISFFENSKKEDCW